jgi:DNA repair protein RecN (Recombination protein N)
MLDQFGGEPLRRALRIYTDAFDVHEAAASELAMLRDQARDRAREIDLLQHGLDEVSAVDPQTGEDAALRVEDERLSHAEGLRTAAALAHARLAGAQEYAEESAPSAMDAVAAARHALTGEVDHDPALRELDRRLADLGYLTADLASDLSSYLEDVEVDPGRLAWVQQRRADLTRLTRKYGETVDDVLEWGRVAAERLAQLLGSDSRIEQLELHAAQLERDRAAAGSKLTAARRKAARVLAAAVTQELAHLAMGQASVEVSVSPRTSGLARHGGDDVEILLAANPGSTPRTVARAASGGELSRVMLALEVVTGAASGSDVPTFVFDEVDAGVGGAAAVEVGRRLAQLARSAQVLVVTHLPQVAAYADQHVVVEKASDGTVTSSGLTLLDDAGRERELSRMLAGLSDSDTALAHARELLEVARAAR